MGKVHTRTLPNPPKWGALVLGFALYGSDMSDWSLQGAAKNTWILVLPTSSDRKEKQTNWSLSHKGKILLQTFLSYIVECSHLKEKKSSPNIMFDHSTYMLSFPHKYGNIRFLWISHVKFISNVKIGLISRSDDNGFQAIWKWLLN